MTGALGGEQAQAMAEVGAGEQAPVQAELGQRAAADDGAALHELHGDGHGSTEASDEQAGADCRNQRASGPDETDCAA